MADNPTLQSDTLASLPAGGTYAFDDVGGVLYQREKLSWGVDGSAVDASASNPLPVVQTGTPSLPTGASTVAEQQTQTTALGSLTETAPGTDTASSGLNGRLQRIAQRLSSLVALLPTSLGQKTKANSLAVAIASDQDTLAVSLASVPSHAVTNAGTFATQAAQSGTWTVQPGNTANTTAWKVDGSAVTQPVSLATLPALVAGTAAIGKLVANSGVDIGDVDVTSVAGTATNAAAQVTVTNTSGTIVASRSGRRGVMLLNLQTVSVFVDPSGGTATTSHFELLPGAAVVLPVTSAITGITSAAYSASGNTKVQVVELY